MATGSDKKVHGITAFNSGEYSSDLAGRTDLESFASSSRYSCNFLTQVSGGLKKFYGTYHITEKTLEEGYDKIKMIPFVNKYEPMVFVIYGREGEFDTDDDGTSEPLKVGLLYGDRYKDLDLKLPTTISVEEIRWQQINDRLILCHKSISPITIDFYGVDPITSDYVFMPGDITFKEVPYFPIGTTNDYFGELEADRLDGTVTLSIPTNTSDIKVEFTPKLIAQSSYVRSANVKCEDCDAPGYHGSMSYYWSHTVSVEDSYIKIYRDSNGTVTLLTSGKVNSYALKYRTGHDHNVSITDTVSQDKVLQVVKTISPSAYKSGTKIVMPDLPGHTDGDSYYMELDIGRVRYIPRGSSTWTVLWATDIETSEPYTPAPITTTTLNVVDLQGRKIKFFFNDDTIISPWWQGKSVTTGDYAYSNGHWYKAKSTGTCGNVQPSHTFGTHTDGGVAWKYVHSGSTTAVVGDVIDASSFKVYVPNGLELPSNTKNAQDKYIMKNYSWSIWGKDGVYPSEVYMVGGRVGFVCNTRDYGSWNAMSVTDDYFNFATEEFGEQLDTSAIVGLIGNNEASDINWVLARTKLYMGGYSGEYFVNPGGSQRRSSVYTPTGTVVENISNMGGRPVVPLKYKELNMFVGGSGKELYTISYDYTTDDYSPRMLGYLTQHIMERGIRRMEAVNNLDRNIYMLHDTNELSLFNYAAEQKVLGFTELNFGNEIMDFCTTHANEEVGAYVAVKRNDGKITFERLAIEKPTYMFDEIQQGDGETDAAFVPVPHFANRTVWIKYGDDLSQFVKVTLDENGDVSHDIYTGVYLPTAKKFAVGLPMVSELHTQPAFGQKVEGHQQQSLSVYVRLNKSGAFEYGCSVDFDKYFKYDMWNTQQEYSVAHRLYTGDIKLDIPLGYAEAQNQGEGKYPNDTAVGLNIRSDTPEPLNILSVQEIYV